MRIYTFNNPGPYGSYEEGVVIELDEKRVVICDHGVFEPTQQAVFKNQKNIDPKDLISAIIERCSNRIAGDLELQKQFLGLVNLDLLRSLPPIPSEVKMVGFVREPGIGLENKFLGGKDNG